MVYTPPTGNAIVFDLKNAYTPPLGNELVLNLGIEGAVTGPFPLFFRPT